MRLTPATITLQIGIISVLFFVLALGLLGRGDYEDEQREMQAYCDNVAAGVWPAYRGEEVQCE
tara:strand:- start:3259 stop:3447 length:189 start_codon:yes stop_codon:yes gene_type:complete